MLADHAEQVNDRGGDDCDRDYFMSAIEAKEYGLVDNVVAKHESSPDEDKKGK